MLQLTTIVFLIASSVLAVIHNLAIQLYLYWNIWWLDIPVHAFGGMIVSLGFFALRDLRLFPNQWLTPIPVMTLVLVIALSWEVYEHVIGILVEGNYVLDTFIDIAMGLLGGFIGYVIGNSLRKLH